MLHTDLIFSYISGKEYSLPENADISVLYAVSKRHDLAHLLAAALEKRKALVLDKPTFGYLDWDCLAAYDEVENELMRMCDLHNIPVATNIATAEVIITALDRGDLSWREIWNPRSEYNRNKRMKQ